MSATAGRGRIAIVGAGPGGMATALAAARAGFEVSLYERYGEVKAAGNILNLWPPPQKVLRLIGVDTVDLGAPAHASFRRNDGRLRATIELPDEVIAEYGGGFIGLLRWGLYKRMLDALPEGVLKLGHDVVGLADRGDRVLLQFSGREPAEADVVVGADGIRSFVRAALWGDQPIRHQQLHLVGGYVFLDGPPPNDTVVMHDRTTQGSYSAYAFHRLPRPLRPLRDLVYDHTPLLQKVVGEDTPKHILSRLAEIDVVESRRPAAAVGAGRRVPDRI